MKPILKFKTEKYRVCSLGNECSVPDLLGTRILQNNLEFHLEENDEIFEGYGTLTSSYPYRQYNCYQAKPEEKEMKTAILENDYIRAIFLPELGGRLWALIDKISGQNLLYTNDVIKFRNLAIRNAWFSGGVEWNLGIIGHTPFTTEQLFTAELTDEDGNPVLRMYEYERVRQVEYQMDFWLGENDHHLNCRMRIVNSGKEVVPMYWWSNMAVPEYDKGRVIVPASKAFTSDAKDVKKVDIPYVDGIDISRYKDIPAQVDYFFDIAEKDPKYIANVDKNGYGLLHVSTRRLRSRKLFSWGNNQGSDNWQQFLTENAGRYVEIQAGIGKTQYGCIPMPPHSAWEWMEQYSAIQLDSHFNELSFEELRNELTNYVKDKYCPDELEKVLQQRKKTALCPGKLVYSGSGYGSFKQYCREIENDRPLSEHLDYGEINDTQKIWADFLNTGILKEPSTEDVPGDFICDDEIYRKLKGTIKSINCKNWYAYYQMGIYEFWKGEIETARLHFEESLNRKKSPWAYHGLGCCNIFDKQYDLAIECIVKGLATRKDDLSYVKESFRLLLKAEGYQALLEQYADLSDQFKAESRIYFDYLEAMSHTGEANKVYEILKSNDTYELVDLREGDSSIERLWVELEKTLFGQCKSIPDKYNYSSL